MVSECCSALEKRSCLVCSVQASHPPSRSDETKLQFIFLYQCLSIYILQFMCGLLICLYSISYTSALRFNHIYPTLH